MGRLIVCSAGTVSILGGLPFIEKEGPALDRYVLNEHFSPGGLKVYRPSEPII